MASGPRCEGASGPVPLHDSIRRHLGSAILGGEVRDLIPKPLCALPDDSTGSRIGSAATLEAVRFGPDFAREQPERCAVILGPGTGEWECLKRSAVATTRPARHAPTCSSFRG